MSIRVSLRVELQRLGPMHVYQCDSCGGSGSWHDCAPEDVEETSVGWRCGRCAGRGEVEDFECQCPECCVLAGEAVAYG